MNVAQTKMSERFLNGLKFLVAEAERNGINRIARILRRGAKDIRAILKEESSHQSYDHTKPDMSDRDPPKQGRTRK